MKSIYLTTIALLATFAVPALAEAPVFPGAKGTPCDAEKFTPVFSADGATVLYWNNPTCVYNGQGGQPVTEPVEEVAAPVDPEEPDEEIISDDI